MPVPIQTQLFDAFLGTQEGIHSVILPDIFSSGGSKNVYIDKFARVSQIGGYTKVNAAAYTTNVGASAAMVRALIPYRSTGGGAFARKLIYVLDDQTNEWEIWASSDGGATGSFLYDAGAGSVGQVPDAAQFGDNLYITNGKVAPRIYNGTAILATGLLQSPTVTATDSGVSGNLKGNYKYKLVSTIAGARQAGSTPSTSLLLVDKQGSLSWTADADVTVDGYEVYRTTGTGTIYYYLTTISGRLTVAYTDNISDTTLLEQRILEEHGDNPPVAYFCEPHKQRMWWLRTDASPTIAYWSDPGEPESVYALNNLDFSDSETVGDVITGALGNYEGLLVVFTEKALWTVSGTGAVIGDFPDWSKQRTNAQTGCVTHRSAVRIPAGAKYTDSQGKDQLTSVTSIAYFTPLGDIRIFDGDNDLIVSYPVLDTLRSFNYAQRAKIHAIIDSANDQAIWFVPTGAAGEPDVCVSWNYRHGVWYVWRTMPFSSSCDLDSSSDASTLLVGESLTTKGAYIYSFLNGNSFDGSNIEAIWMTKTLSGVTQDGQPAISNTKRWRWADLLFRISQDVDITIGWMQGNSPDTASVIASITVSPDAQLLMTADGSLILAADGSSILLSSESAQAQALLQTATGDYLHDEGIRLRVGTNGTAGGWSLEAMQLAYQILPGLKRRFQ